MKLPIIYQIPVKNIYIYYLKSSIYIITMVLKKILIIMVIILFISLVSQKFSFRFEKKKILIKHIIHI